MDAQAIDGEAMGAEQEMKERSVVEETAELEDDVAAQVEDPVVEAQVMIAVEADQEDAIVEKSIAEEAEVERGATEESEEEVIPVPRRRLRPPPRGLPQRRASLASDPLSIPSAPTTIPIPLLPPPNDSSKVAAVPPSAKIPTLATHPLDHPSERRPLLPSALRIVSPRQRRRPVSLLPPSRTHPSLARPCLALPNRPQDRYERRDRRRTRASRGGTLVQLSTRSPVRRNEVSRLQRKIVGRLSSARQRGRRRSSWRIRRKERRRRR